MSEIITSPARLADIFCSSVRDDVWHDQTGSKAFESWYFDALSDDGKEAVVVIFSDNYVFSPRYAAESDPGQKPERFPAVTFIYSNKGRTIFRTVNEFGARRFRSNTGFVECSIGDSSFTVDAAAYGSGYFVKVDIPVAGNRRLKASFEWLSIDADLLPPSGVESAFRNSWNMVAPRSDVTGRIELLSRRGFTRKLFQFRGTGYHDHLRSEHPIHETIGCRQWGRAHFNDATAIYCIENRPGITDPEARLYIVRDGRIRVSDAVFEGQRFQRDRFGVKYPTRLSFLTDDNSRLRVKQFRPIDSTFFDVRSLAEMTLLLPDGRFRKAIGMTEFLLPKNIKYRLFRWFTDLKIGREGKGATV